MGASATKKSEFKLPAGYDWRTSDADEINKRRQRARDEAFEIANADPRHPIFSDFRVKSQSGLTYAVEIRSLEPPQHACDCVDFRINGLGTCKHIEAVRLLLETRFRRAYAAACRTGSTRLDVGVDPTRDALRLFNAANRIPRSMRRWFGEDGHWLNGEPEAALESLAGLRQSELPNLRISQEVQPWLDNRRHAAERKQLRHEYELRVQSGEWPAHETTVPLFPYQREGMLHLAFTERALLADEMGLGKTIQAIAACALLHRLGRARHALVVTPASLKTEWEEQIRRFTPLPYQLVFGDKKRRLAAYDAAPFFTIANYEQMVGDALDVNARLTPDIVVLDEAQRIKNWNTKTAQAVKRLHSRYAFVLTGTPIENRIDELHSLMDFLNPTVLGPLFRFNRDFYDLDERGRPVGYRNLDQLHARIRPHLLRRRKADVETELPERTDRNHFVKLTESQTAAYAPHAQQVLRLTNIALRRPLSQPEQDKLQRELAMMRMICDTNYILDPDDTECPKLGELEKLLDDCRANDAKVIVFSEWERMLELVRGLCQRMNFGFAWHTGRVPQQRRRAEINAFKSDPDCRVFLSTDSGATGLNLQTASVVINCDLPWNPAKLEQRIARAWRKNQSKPVTVINLVAEGTIEHRMLDTLALKQTVADSVLDHPGTVKEIKLRSGRQAFVERIQQLVSPASPAAARPGSGGPDAAETTRKLPADPALAFAQLARERVGSAVVRCEERYPNSGSHSVLVVVVDRDPGLHRERLTALHGELFGPGKTDPLAPTQLEVIDQATDDAIQRLIAAGLITRTTRASRPLASADATSTPPPLSPEEQAQAKTHRDTAGRKFRMARLLDEGGLPEEARGPLLEGARILARALAIEARLPEPASLEDALLPPWSQAWKQALPLLRAFAGDASQPVRPLLEQVGTV